MNWHGDLCARSRPSRKRRPLARLPRPVPFQRAKRSSASRSGTFNPDSTEAYFKQQKLATSKVASYTLYAFGSGTGPNDLFFFFIDSSKAAFGQSSCWRS